MVNIYHFFVCMGGIWEPAKKPNPEDIYHYGSDLTIPHVRKISEAIQSLLDQDPHAAALQATLRKDERVAQIHQEKNYSEPRDMMTRKTIKELRDAFVGIFHQVTEAVTQILQKSNTPKPGNTVVAKTVAELREIFEKAFSKVASQAEYAWIDYNTPLQTEIRFNILFGPQIYVQWAESWDRKHYRISEFLSHAPKESEKRKRQKRRFLLEGSLAENHRLFCPDTYDELQERFFSCLESVIGEYVQEFAIDASNTAALSYFVNKYFTFIVIQGLLRSRLVFECKSNRGNAFVAQMIDNIREYLQKRYAISIDSPTFLLQKKLFNNIGSDTIWPIELNYPNALFKNIEERETYFNQHYLIRRGKHISSLRSEIMDEFSWGTIWIDKTFEIRNPGYYYYQDQIDKAKDRLNQIEPGEKMEMMPLLPPIFKEIEKFRQGQKPFTTSVEENPIQDRTPSPTLIEIQQKYLRKYNVPVQFWPLFNIAVYKNNHYYQVKSALMKKTDEYNVLMQDIFLHKNSSNMDIIHHINAIITNREFDANFEKKREEKKKIREQEMKKKILISRRSTQIKEARKTQTKRGKMIIEQQEIPFED